MESTYSLRRFHPHPLVEWALRWATQVFIFVSSGLGAFLLRFDFNVPADEWVHVAYAVPIWVVVKTVAFHMFRLDNRSWRYISAPELLNITWLNLLASCGGMVTILLLAPQGLPRSVYVLDFLLCVCATAGIRVVTRLCGEKVDRPDRKRPSKRVLIYGAGNAGVCLLREIRMSPKLGWRVCGFIDDDPGKRDLLIQEVPVFDSRRDLAGLVREAKIDEILIAIPSAAGPQMVHILQRCQNAGAPFRTIPRIADIIEGSGLTTQIRNVAVEDLLGRRPVNLDETAVRRKVDGRVVLITGAAGSIGSELCRQVARFQPERIVAFEISETGLFHLESEMRALFPGVPFHAEIGNIQNSQRLDELMDEYRPKIVYHAAAYKHVPMMESQVFEAVENNILGTCNVALAAARHGVSDFVMISSDKAVRPTNVMGATKRISELLIKSLHENGTRYVSVRFGNVLGSNGSVVPIFKKQITEGGPVTVTHPDMRRYFMTIPEAVQLVLQASTMGQGGEIFVLDMGEPVRIVDLARNLILLSGLRPDEDIRIEFTGIRAGEKLYEELSGYDENTAVTDHAQIKVLMGSGLPNDAMAAYVRCLREACEKRDFGNVLLCFKEIVPDYNPSSAILKSCLDVEHSIVHSSVRGIGLPVAATVVQ
ncbi:MAG: nucleoside-diphosphate sugar epimerase/dehydratase [Bryobacteraceae bacterium]